MSATVCALIAGSLQLIAQDAFTLSWQHSVQRLRWEEDWQVAGQQLRLVEARIQGTGAGMEIPPDAVLRQGSWHYRPPLAPQSRLTLANSIHGGQYRICEGKRCKTLPAGDAPLTLQVCP
ncbi:DUF1850 domain-containing protein [Uliginosibacterium paludis]|uniref:DUF1850 domain-containing protein n=1 Tax=Uliginosibacterium paludis TaxID=1615952 RepID=A0ABV2CLU6_9RHOO